MSGALKNRRALHSQRDTTRIRQRTEIVDFLVPFIFFYIFIGKQINMIYIYTLSHPITNEVRYVGKTINVNRRFKQHLHDKRCSHKASWVKSLKNEGLKPIMTILETCSDNWQEREIYWMSQYDNLTNLKKGGGIDYVRTTSEETKQKISQANLGKPKTSEHKEKIKQSMLNNIVSHETKNKMMLKNTNRKEIFINNVLFESIHNASRILKIPKTTIFRRINNDKFPEYQYKNQPVH